MNRRHLFKIPAVTPLVAVPFDTEGVEAKALPLEPGHYLIVVSRDKVRDEGIRHICAELSGHGVTGIVLPVYGDPDEAIAIYKMGEI